MQVQVVPLHHAIIGILVQQCAAVCLQNGLLNKDIVVLHGVVCLCAGHTTYHTTYHTTPHHHATPRAVVVCTTCPHVVQVFLFVDIRNSSNRTKILRKQPPHKIKNYRRESSTHQAHHWTPCNATNKTVLN